MRAVEDSIREGHYARKQIFCRDRLISWSHRSRFEIGLELARQFAGKRILDYGCGDGAFLAMLNAGPSPPAEALGVEVVESVVQNCQTRLGGPGINFVTLDQIDGRAHHHAYDAVICMEVLEHMLDVESILDRFDGLLAPNGKLLISVPIETGLPLLVKQTLRRVAGWRGIGDYPGTSSYAPGEYVRSIFANSKTRIQRTIHSNPDGSQVYDHKGFNWMALRELLSRHFIIEETVSSPVSWLTPHIASQVWFVARSRCLSRATE